MDPRDVEFEKFKVPEPRGYTCKLCKLKKKNKKLKKKLKSLESIKVGDRVAMFDPVDLCTISKINEDNSYNLESIIFHELTYYNISRERFHKIIEK